MTRQATIPIAFQFPVTEVEAIEAAAKAAGLSRAAWCKQALRAALRPEAKADSPESL